MAAGETAGKVRREEMKEELFDKKIKELLDSCTETPAPEVWDRIETGLGRRRRQVVWRRIAGYAAAASVAACLAVSVFLHWNIRQPDSEILAVEVSPGIQDTEAPLRSRAARIKALPGITAQVSAVSGREDLIAAAAAKRNTVRPGARKEAVSDGAVGVNGASVQKQAPSIYDRTFNTEYIAMVSDDGCEVRKKPAFSLQAGGNLSPTRASGNVDFSQPNYSWGAGTTSASAGIVPVSEPSHYFPVSVGVELKCSFLNERLGIGLGVNYTFLNSRYEALVDRKYQASVDQSIHYLGIPLNFYVGILSDRRFSFYANAGCMMERAVRIEYEMTDLYSMKNKYDAQAQGVQWSANVGVGFEYRFLTFMGLYVDPRLTYYFDCGQPYSVRTEQPLQFNLEVGFRFHIGS